MLGSRGALPRCRTKGVTINALGRMRRRTERWGEMELNMQTVIQCECDAVNHKGKNNMHTDSRAQWSKNIANVTRDMLVLKKE